MEHYVTALTSEILTLYIQGIQVMTRSTWESERARLVRLINGDVFFKLTVWAVAMRRKFMKVPLGDTDTFQVCLFLIGKISVFF